MLSLFVILVGKSKGADNAVLDMFEPKQNPGYQKLLKDATGLVASWTKNEWYESSSDAQEACEDAN